MASSVEPVSLSQIKKVEGVRAQWTLREVEVALDETREQRERRIRELFTMFDCENSGYLDHAQVEKGFKALIPSHYKYAKDLLDVCDSNHDGRVDFQEFHKYIDEKEVELYNMFQQIDVTNDGSIRPEELRDALRTAGIHINDDDLSKFVEHIDRDKNGIITFEEWRDFLLLFPHAGTIIQVYQYWEKVCQVDIGEQAIIPEGISRHLHASKYLIAGGVAGAISRTATAPLDRLKVILQVQTHTSGSTSLVRGLMQIYRESGLVGFFRGNGINILKVVPEQAIKFYAFEMMKDFIATKGEEEEEEKEEEENKNKKSIGTVGRLVAGGVAGAIAQTFVYPMDVLKTRLQVHSSPSPPLNSLLRNIWIEEGPVALFRGIVPSLIGIVPYAGIDLATYETLKDLSRRLPFFADGKNVTQNQVHGRS